MLSNQLRHAILATVLFVPLAAAPAGAQNWPTFRAFGGVAVGKGTSPATWDVTRSINVVWKTPITGIALSSPIVWDNRIYLTTSVPMAPPKGENFRTPHQWKLMSFDIATGKMVWETTAHEGVPHMDRHPVSSYANSTPATDGRYVVALFGTDVFACFERASGKLLWKKDINQDGVDPRSGHFGSSPVIVGDLAILQNDRDEKSSYVAAYNLKDGAEVWKRDHNEGQAQSTPAVAWTNGPGGRTPLLVVAGPKSLRAVNAQTGKDVWSMNVDAQFTVAMPTVADDLVIFGGWGRNKPVYAVRTDSSGVLSPQASAEGGVLWKTERGGTEIPTPLVAGGLVYILGGNGVLSAYDLRDGRQIYQQRAGSGEYYASPVISGDKIYIMNTDGEVTVLRAGPAFEVLARNTMGESTSATPAIINGAMYVRTSGSLIALRDGTAKK